MNASIVTLITGLMLASVMFPDRSGAQEGQFYAGKTLTLYAGMPVGGGVDDEMRLAARHLSRFIPGQPTIIARNMPGAGGVVLGNYLRHNAAPDGLTLGMPTRSGFLLSNVVKQSGNQLRPYRVLLRWRCRQQQRHALAPQGRPASPICADLRNSKKEIVIGGLAPRTQSALLPRVLAKYEGWPFKVVHGYPGFNEVLIAMERGEVDGLFTAGQISRPDMVTSGFLIPVLQSMEEHPGVPLMADAVSDSNARALLGLLLAPSRIGLPLMGPPNIPAERLELLRRSYLQMTADKDFRDESEKRGMPVGRALGGAELHKLVAENLSSVPENVVKEYLSLMQ